MGIFIDENTGLVSLIRKASLYNWNSSPVKIIIENPGP